MKIFSNIVSTIKKDKLIMFHLFCMFLVVFAICSLLLVKETRDVSKYNKNVFYQFNHRMTNAPWNDRMYYGQQYSRKIINNVGYITKSNLEMDVRADKHGKLFIFHDDDFYKRNGIKLDVAHFDVKDAKKFNVERLESWVRDYANTANKIMVEFKFDYRLDHDASFLLKEQKLLSKILRPIKNKVIINSFRIKQLAYFRKAGYKVYLDLRSVDLMKHFDFFNRNVDGIFLKLEKLKLKLVNGHAVPFDKDYVDFANHWKKGMFFWFVNEGNIANVSKDSSSEYLATLYIVENLHKFFPFGTIINKATGHYTFNEIIKEQGMIYISKLKISSSRRAKILKDFIFSNNHQNYRNSNYYEKWKSNVLKRIK